jgi:CheY-like chemotaxis protein
MFTVNDSGIRMTQVQVTQLFTVFVQADTSISRTYGGIGLGPTIISIAENGEIALEMLEQASYDLVLMDIQMPIMDGYTATRLIRENEKYSQLPILAMTANAMKQDIDQCHEAGMNDHISKPIDPNLAFTKIEKWLAKSK